MDEFERDQEIKRSKAKIKRDADFAKAEFEQRRSGFKTEAEFEEEKALQFKAILKKRLEEELALLQKFGREKDKLRIEEIKGQIEGLGEFEKAAESNHDIIEKAIQLTEDIIVKSLDTRIDRAREEEQAHKDSLNEFKQAARDGNITAKESLAEEQRLAEEAQVKQAELEQKKQNTLFVSAVLKAFALELDNPDNNGDSFKAFGKAVLSTEAISQFASALPAFLEGTENTGEHGAGVDGKGGFHALLHSNERVLTSGENTRIGDFTNEEVAQTMEQKRLGNLMGDTQLIAMANGVDLSGMEAKLESIERAIIDKPETNIELGDIAQESFNIVHRTKAGNRTTTNTFKVRTR